MKRKPCIVFVLSILFVYVAMLGFFVLNQRAAKLPEAVDQQIVTIGEGELLSGGQGTRVTLPSYFDVTKELRLQFTLNYTFSGRTVPSLILQANHTFMTILLNGEEIYHVEPQLYSLGNYFTRIPLPQKVNNAQLEIRVTVPENGLTRIEVPELTIANEAVFFRQQMWEDIPSLLLNTLIMLSGVLLLILALSSGKSMDPYRMLLRGFLALNCAVYFMCETLVVVFLATTPRTIYIIDMLSFAMLGPPLLVLFGWELEDWRGKLLKIIAGIGMAVVIAQVFILLTSGVELRRLLPMTHMVQIASILAIIVCIVYGLIRKKNNGGLYVGGVIALGGTIDITLFMCEIGEKNIFFLKIGLLIYLFQQMYQFIHLLMKHSAEEARETYYKAMAMHDPLSNCYSRAAFELDKDAWDGEAVRTAFFLDLNNLKQTNDLYGHGTGDQLIRALGEVLNVVFFSVGKCYRVGGDEFWVLCNDLAPGQSDEMMRAAQQAIDTYNRNSDLPTNLSYAIGVSDTNETHGDLTRAIELADARMYENKRIVKQAMKS